MTAHTPTPWAIRQHPTDGGVFVVQDEPRHLVATMGASWKQTDPKPHLENAARIIECVNGCAELPEPAGLPAALDELCRLASLDEVSPRAIARVLDQLGVSS